MSGNPALRIPDIPHGADLHRAVLWWLRSSYSSDYNYAYYVYSDGGVSYNGAYDANYCARPALACKYAEIQ